MTRKVAVIKSNYTPYGGGEKYASAVLKAFIENGCEVHVLTSSKENWFQDGVKGIKIKMWPFNNFLKLYTFNKNCYQYLSKNLQEYDCILDMDRTVLATHIRAGGGSHRGWLERRARFSSPIKNFSFQINPFHRYMLEIEKKSLKNPYLRMLICNSHMVKEEFVKYYNFDEKRIAVVYNGVEWESFKEPFQESLKNKLKAKKRVGFDDSFWFIFVGSGYERKGLKFVLHAMQRINKDFKLAVIGKDRNENVYKVLAKELNIDGKVFFYGPRKDVVNFLMAADAFIMPTIYDPFSNATLEALAMGLYTITSNANGCGEIIKDRCGYVIKDLKNIEEIADAMIKAPSYIDREYIRRSVSDFDFNKKLSELISICLNT